MVSRASLERRAFRTAAATEARVRGFESTTVDVHGLPVSVLRSGSAGRDAPVIVMLHGFSADKTLWMRFASAFTKDYRILAPDLAGHGATPFRSGSDYSAAGQAELVRGLLDAHGVDAAHVVGNSMGGFVTATMAADHPSRVLTAAMIDPAGLWPRAQSELDRLRREGRNPFFMDDASEMSVLTGLVMAKPPTLPGFAVRAMAAEYVERRESLVEIFDAFAEVGLLEGRLGEITCPSLVMWGALDKILDVEAAPVWAAELPDAELIIYDGVGHMPMVEIPRRSASDYRRFLERVAARR